MDSFIMIEFVNIIFFETVGYFVPLSKLDHKTYINSSNPKQS